jgi:NTP pyrophosphatase (non-canonical NTP hydrolase)
MADKTIEEEILEFANSQWGEKTWEGLGLKLGEEAGEVAGAIVKIPEKRATLEDLDLEVGDTLIVLSQIAARLGTTLEALQAKRFEQIKERASKRGCAACDRGDYQLGHRDGCPGIVEDAGAVETVKAPLPTHVRIRDGVTVYQDHRSWTWPNLSNVEDPNMAFRTISEVQGWVILEAPKFGEKGNYGNGRASVKREDLMEVPKP